MTPSCPRCPGSPLLTSSTHGVWVMYCDRCWGMWVDAGSVRHVAAAAIADARAVHAEALPCPVCRAAMGAWHARGVVIDRCDAHGVWFDRAELDHLVAAASQPVAPAASASVGLGTVAVVAGGAALAGGVALAMGSEQPRSPGGAAIDGAAVGEVAVDVVDTVHSALPLADVGVGGAVEVVAESAGGVAEAIGDAIGAVFSIFS